LNINTERQGSISLIIPDGLSENGLQVLNEWFDPDYWQQLNCISGQAKGRFITWFIQPFKQLSDKPSDKPIEWVLRHYYRGGMVAKLSKDSFLYTGIKNTRCYLEVNLLQAMLDMDLPVPKPIAARVVRNKLFYTADLLMEKLDATDLFSLLKERQLLESEWRNIGKVVASFHHKGVYHSDLNAHNIMIDSNHKTWLIDFDRCEIRTKNIEWQQQNLARLKRSFMKEKSIDPSSYFDDQSWSYLQGGYDQWMNENKTT